MFEYRHISIVYCYKMKVGDTVDADLSLKIHQEKCLDESDIPWQSLPNYILASFKIVWFMGTRMNRSHTCIVYKNIKKHKEIVYIHLGVKIHQEGLGEGDSPYPKSSIYS